MSLKKLQKWGPAFAGTLALMLSAGGCALFPSGPESASADASTPKEGRSGPELQADALLAADRAFAEESLKLGAPEAFSRYFDPQGFQIGPSGPPAVGPDEVRATLSKGAANILSWEPRFAEVFAPGGWGWTWGDWQLHEPGAGWRRAST